MIQSPTGQDGIAELRVILVGATGLDASLRRDPSIELIRSRTPLDAIGELADPIDQTSPTRSVVIVGGEPARGDAAQTRQFIEGLRLVDPYVRVLQVRGQADHTGGLSGAEADLFDAQVSPDDKPEDLLAVIRGTRRQARVLSGGSERVAQGAPPARGTVVAGGKANGSVPTRPTEALPSPWVSAATGPAKALGPGTVPPSGKPRLVSQETTVRPPAALETASQTTRPASPTNSAGADAPRSPRTEGESFPESIVERKPARGGVGDEQLAADVARGRDCVPQAMDLMRARVAPARVEFVEGDAGDVEGRAGGADWLSAQVRWGATTYGQLVGDGIAPADLQRQADWLATWTRLGEQQRELRDAAYRDPLTGAWNRRYFDRFMDAALAKSRDGRHALTILMFDIDDFKVYNDRYGHAAGDEILKEVVRLLQATIRPTDRVCRIGGDEFAVVFYEPTGPREAGSRHPSSFFDIAKRFQKQVWEHRFPKLGAQAPGTLTVSGGLATFPWDGATPQELLDKADRLAMDSKRLGKNAITLGPGSMRACNGQE